MIVYGTLGGESCRHKEYVYRIPLLSPICYQRTEEELTVQEKHINVLVGIDMKKVDFPTLKYKEVARYRFESEENKYGQKIVKLFMTATEYTMAKKDRQVGEWIFTGPDYDYVTISKDEVLDKLLKEGACI